VSQPRQLYVFRPVVPRPAVVLAFLCGDLDPRWTRRCCLRFRCSRASNA
jgi:hypothetical protein